MPGGAPALSARRLLRRWIHGVGDSIRHGVLLDAMVDDELLLGGAKPFGR